jgi:hypothetical protein
MKKVLIAVSVYRQGERMHPVIPVLAENVELSLLCVHQMNDQMYWNGTIDMRKYFHNTYDDYFSHTYQNWKQIDYSKYDAILLDDCRAKGECIPYEFIYKEAKKYNTVVFSASHGNSDYVGHIYEVDHHKRVFDYCFLFGEWYKQKLDPKNNKTFLLGGIPSNDILSNYKDIRTDEYILIITNFLANERKVFPTVFGDKFVKEIDLKAIQDKYKKPVVVKIKNRDRHFALGNPYQDDIKFVQSVLKNNGINGTVVRDVEDDNLLIANAHSVIGVASTLCFKPIQLGVPTVIINGGGCLGAFEHFKGRCDTRQVPTILDIQMNCNRDEKYINSIIEGGIDYNSTSIFVNNLLEKI